MLSINTNFESTIGDPEPSLRRIAEAGFTHVHWGHQWCKDYTYTSGEMQQAVRWLREFGLKCADLHASRGYDKGWASPRLHERLAGIELVQNRIEMCARLGGDAVVLHPPVEPADRAENAAHWARFRHTLDALEPFAGLHEVRLAIENCYPDNFPTIKKMLDLYSPDFIGICYDTGHGNWIGTGLDYLEELQDRLLVTHAHDNDGTGDQHKIPFTGNVDWARFARTIRECGYAKPVNLEPSFGASGCETPEGFLAAAFAAGSRIEQMIAG